MEAYAHQRTSLDKMESLRSFFDMSDAGTGKTLVELIDFSERRKRGGGRALVFAPKSIMAPAWGNDIDTLMPGMTYGIATAENRKRPFQENTDVVITNPAAMKVVAANKQLLKGFDTLIIDESTCVKNPDTVQFKSVKAIRNLFEWIRLMTATPNPNSVLELWSQAFILDGGERLGNSYWKFRNVACTPVQIGPQANHVEWHDKEGIEGAVFDLLSDVSIRHKLEECISIPPNTISTVSFSLSKACQKVYDDMVKHAIADFDGTEIKSVHAAALAQKLMQIASGAVYAGDDAYTVLDAERCELIMDLLDARPHSIVFFNWKHQRDQLIAAANKRKYTHTVIDGDVTEGRQQIVSDFQAGKYKVMFAHPRSAGHGLTLTRATTTIWASPNWSSELFKQANARIYRNGQTQRTETILVSAKGTVDEKVYCGVGEKLTAMQLLLDLMEGA